jgi:hypothetical protein
MPTPEGQLTTSQIWTGKGEENESNQETQTEETDTSGAESIQSSEEA